MLKLAGNRKPWKLKGVMPAIPGFNMLDILFLVMTLNGPMTLNDPHPNPPIPTLKP
jgi:hypothetical protein